MLTIIAAHAAVTAMAVQAPAPRLTDASAQAIVEGCRSFAADNALTVAIAVLDDRSELVAYLRMDGLRQGPAELALEKADYSARWGSETKRLADAVAEGNLGWALTSGGTPIEGGVPVYSTEGVLLGGIGVSGASAADDAKCARAGLAKAGLKDSR